MNKTKCHNCLPPKTKARFINAKGIETKDWPLCQECKKKKDEPQEKSCYCSHCT